MSQVSRKPQTTTCRGGLTTWPLPKTYSRQRDHHATQKHTKLCLVEEDFAGGFNHQTAGNDPTTSKSRSSWVITYAGCPVTWSSKLQTLTALSTTEAKYIALCHNLIPMMELTKEMAEHQIESH